MSDTASSRKPNIIWIMADDLSWGDIGCHGQEKIKTPSIDAIAREGMCFTNGHAGAPVCAPARSTLMQGLHLGHATVRANMSRAASGNVYRHGLQPDDLTVAQVLKDGGYATGLFGKWGLAVHDQPGIPTHMGYDSFFGYLNQRKAHSYYPPYLWRDTEKVLYPENEGHDHHKPNEYDAQGRILVNGVPDPRKATYAFDEYAAESLAFVRGNADRPFFLYLPYTLPHVVYEVPELGEYVKEDWPLRHKILAAMITRMDSAIGELMALLKELGIDEDTLVFFTSDNGYSVAGSAKDPSFDDVFHHRGPWPAGKNSLRQGGVRVPLLARWPGRVAPGSVSDLPWAFYDFMATAADAAGLAIPEKTDGLSVLPALLGHGDRQKKHDYLYWAYGNEHAVRIDRYYAYRRHPNQPTQIYDVFDDPREANDLAADKPDLVKQVEQIFENEFAASLYYYSPGEPADAWHARLAEAGIELPNNVDT